MERLWRRAFITILGSTFIYRRFFCNSSTEGGWLPSRPLAFRYEASDCYDFGTRG